MCGVLAARETRTGFAATRASAAVFGAGAVGSSGDTVGVDADGASVGVALDAVPDARGGGGDGGPSGVLAAGARAMRTGSALAGGGSTGVGSDDAALVA